MAIHIFLSKFKIMLLVKQFRMVTYCGLGFYFKQIWHILSKILFYLKSHKALSLAITDLADIWKLSHSTE
jgi:hypothetical protein